MTPHPLTLASIMLQGHDPGSSRDLWRCGCDNPTRVPGGWRLCQYHVGYEDGVDAWRARAERAEADADRLAAALSVATALPPLVKRWLVKGQAALTAHDEAVAQR